MLSLDINVILLILNFTVVNNNTSCRTYAKGTLYN